MAVVIGATVFGSLAAMLHDAPKPAAIAVTVGLVVSLLPILLRVLPPLKVSPDADERVSNVAVTIIGLILYLAITAGAVILIAV